MLSVSTGNRSAVLIWLDCEGIRLSSGVLIELGLVTTTLFGREYQRLVEVGLLFGSLTK